MEGEDFYEFMNSEEAKQALQKALDKQEAQEKIIKAQTEKVFRVLTNLSDTEFHSNLDKILAWEKLYQERWYEAGVCKTSNILNILFLIAEKYGKELNCDEDFLGSSYEWRGYKWNIYCGQGCFERIIHINTGETKFQSL
jgi:hypothetical protein